MPSSVSSRFLRHVLFADAFSCLGSGALQLLFTGQLAAVLNLPAALLAGTGWFLLVYGPLVGITASREPLPRLPVWLFMGGNALWAVACGALLASRWLAPTAWGAAWILAHAATVAVLALLQWNGLRRSEPLGWA